MSAEIITHPAAAAKGIENARTIIRSPQGVFDDAVVLDACEYLIAYGDLMDRLGAEQLRDFMVRQYVADLNEQGRRWQEGVIEAPAAPPMTLLELLVLAYGVVWIAVALIGALK